MKLVALRAAILCAASTVGAGIGLLVRPDARALVLDVYALTLGGIVLLALVRLTRLLAPVGGASAFERALEAMRPAPDRPAELALERDVELSRVSAFHLHVRLRPVLREIAAHRLSARYGIELDREPGRAQDLVGAQAWELVRPDRALPADRLAAGPSLRSLGEAVDELERL